MVIAVDFDGTLVEEGAFPGIGKAKMDVVNYILKEKERGSQIILWTCRENEYLKEAVRFCEGLGLTFDAVNENVDENRDIGYAKRKVLADVYIDDRAIFVDDLDFKKASNY